MRSGTSQFDNGVDRQAALEVIAALLEKGVEVNARVKEFPPMRRYRCATWKPSIAWPCA